MAVLAADRFLVDVNGTGFDGVLAVPVADNVKIYKGSLVCQNTAGYAVAAADTAGFVFGGIAEEQADNTVTGHTAGGIKIRLASGMVFTLPTAGASQASVGLPVYVTDSGAVGFSSTNGVYVGQCVRFISATSIDVYVVSGGVMNRLLPVVSAAGAILTGATLTVAAVPWSKITVNPGGAVTGIILSVGVFDGQEVCVVNLAAAANSVTPAAAGTSHVADGAVAIAGVTARTFIWDAGSSLWYREA